MMYIVNRPGRVNGLGMRTVKDGMRRSDLILRRKLVVIHEFPPRFFDLSGSVPKEVALTGAERDAFEWGRNRRLTRVRWDPEIDFVIEVGDVSLGYQLEDLQKQLADEYSPHNTSPK
jgi:hypothetical protein